MGQELGLTLVHGEWLARFQGMLQRWMDAMVPGSCAMVRAITSRHMACSYDMGHLWPMRGGGGVL